MFWPASLLTTAVVLTLHAHCLAAITVGVVVPPEFALPASVPPSYNVHSNHTVKF
ncbi:hypothetical protein TIFTF001_024557 [Ficus carica]|uniref:Uncharacterized protein n=1 Tax=Ficus carica TaxID=3494 RepID=A0AA88AVT5_FICCA|nr:hypothetical protein TIFTF001_024557 [Ficus carica]